MVKYFVVCNLKILPVNTEVKLAVLFQLRKQLLFGPSDSHALGKHRVHKELAGLKKKNKQEHMTGLSNF